MSDKKDWETSTYQPKLTCPPNIFRSEELKPCPFCGTPPTKEIPKSDKYEYVRPECVCVSSDTNGDPWAYLEVWQNAECWKELERTKDELAKVKELARELLAALKVFYPEYTEVIIQLENNKIAESWPYKKIDLSELIKRAEEVLK